MKTSTLILIFLMYVTLFTTCGSKGKIIATLPTNATRYTVNLKALRNPTTFGLQIDSAVIIKSIDGSYYLVRYGKYKEGYGSFYRKVYVNSSGDVTIESASSSKCKKGGGSSSYGCICSCEVGGASVISPCAPWNERDGCTGGCTCEADGLQQTGNCMEGVITIETPKDLLSVGDQ